MPAMSKNGLSERMVAFRPFLVSFGEEFFGYRIGSVLRLRGGSRRRRGV